MILFILFSISAPSEQNYESRKDRKPVVIFVCYLPIFYEVGNGLVTENHGPSTRSCSSCFLPYSEAALFKGKELTFHPSMDYSPTISEAIYLVVTQNRGTVVHIIIL